MTRLIRALTYIPRRISAAWAAADARAASLLNPWSEED